MILSLCGMSLSAATGKKAARQAEKLAGDFALLAKARELVKTALSDTTDVPTAYTYWVAGRVEREAYKHYYKQLSINRKDPNVDHVAMADAYMSAYGYFMQCKELDSVPDKKGAVKPKYSAGIVEWLNTSSPAMYNGGIAYMNKKLYYPKAYTAFVEYASLPDKPYFHPLEAISDSLRANAYFYGGVMAYNAKEFEKALDAFTKARKWGYTRKEVFLNQISSLSQLAKTHPETRDSLSMIVTRVAGDAFNVHGIDATPVFLQKFVAGMLLENQTEPALAAVNKALEKHPDMTMLHTMKAGIYSAMNYEEHAVEEYKTAAAAEDADAQTLKLAARYLTEAAIQRLDSITGRGREARTAAKTIRQELLKPALDFATKAKILLPDDAEITNIIETATYRMH